MPEQLDERLSQLANGLGARFGPVALRGSGAATFVFVQSSARAVEASIHDRGIWVEYWESTADDESDAPLKDETLATVEKAEAAIIAWLSASSSQDDGNSPSVHDE
jgi:hypothetical protein